MKKKIFEGSCVALITPFNSDGTVNFNKFEELIEWHIAKGTDAILVCGTTGESATLDISELKALIKFAVEKVNHRVPVIAGAGSNNTAHAIALSRFVESTGVDAILSVVPYYNKTSQTGLFEHFKAIAESVSTPIILYNVPGRTGLNMSTDTIERLAQIENIVAIKECDFSHVGIIKKNCPADFSIYTGEDALVVPALAMGASGVISVMANIIPEDTHMICENFWNKNIDAAREGQLKTLDLVHALFIEASPAPTKKAMNLLGMEVGGCRLPIVSMEIKNQSMLIDVMKQYGLLK